MCIKYKKIIVLFNLMFFYFVNFSKILLPTMSFFLFLFRVIIFYCQIIYIFRSVPILNLFSCYVRNINAGILNQILKIINLLLHVCCACYQCDIRNIAAFGHKRFCLFGGWHYNNFLSLLMSIN